ncbi:hypothetical protein EWM64_g7393 [Hericium alpestre]|uniref:Uncharacterized protein n=1 Tax=Hericium alpestre TaxID=135208 RepID=A0A4Y9ZT08_9AGAM|nr:hypothetical protein EWM64_g7393 [Hericium alpestre]
MSVLSTEDEVEYESLYQAFLTEKALSLYDPLILPTEEYEQGKHTFMVHLDSLWSGQGLGPLPSPPGKSSPREEGSGYHPSSREDRKCDLPQDSDHSPMTQPDIAASEVGVTPIQSVVDVPLSRNAKPGFVPQDVSVLSVWGHMGGHYSQLSDVHLDFCTDVTLMSSEFYRSLLHPPKLRQGLHIQLVQLTVDGGVKAEGFVCVPIFFPSREGPLLRIMVEAYVVPKMTVPLLLGEDFHLTYEIAVARNLDMGTIVSFRNCLYELLAHSVQLYRTPQVQRSLLGVQSFVHAMTHCRAKVKHQKCRHRARLYKAEIWAAHDYRILPGTVKKIEIIDQFTEEKDWLIQQSLLSSGKDDFFITPNTLFFSRSPVIPVTNHTLQPRFICKGDIVSMVINPAKFFDAPEDLAKLEDMITKAAQISQLIKNLAETKDPSSQPTSGEVPPQKSYKWPNPAGPLAKQDPNPPTTPLSWPIPVVDIPWDPPSDPISSQQPSPVGPKTAELPDPTFYPSDRLHDLLDVGSLPDHLKEEAWSMLERRVKAFSFDRRLGHHPAKARIHMDNDHPPISVPMYGSSP